MSIELVNSMVNCHVTDGIELSIVSTEGVPVSASLPADEFLEYWQLFDNDILEEIIDRESSHAEVFIASQYASVLPAHWFILPPKHGTELEAVEFNPQEIVNEASKHLGIEPHEAISKVNFYGRYTGELSLRTAPSGSWKWSL